MFLKGLFLLAAMIASITVDVKGPTHSRIYLLIRRYETHYLLHISLYGFIET